MTGGILVMYSPNHWVNPSASSSHLHCKSVGKIAPDYFTPVTKVIHDNIQADMMEGTAYPEHPQERATLPAATSPNIDDDPISGHYIYVDDFISTAIQDANNTFLARISWIILHNIHSVFPPPSITWHEGGKDPVSKKKLDKGDATWSPHKEILGFKVDSTQQTIRLPEDKANDICHEIARVLKKKRYQFKCLRKLIGKLQHLLCLHGLFTPLNQLMSLEPKYVDLHGPSICQKILCDFHCLMRELKTRPTHVQELLQSNSHFIGYTDALGVGARGVWFGLALCHAILWRLPWPPDIQCQLVSDSNHTGYWTISDLELVALVLSIGILDAATPTRHCHLGLFSDNPPTVSWTAKMASNHRPPWQAISSVGCHASTCHVSMHHAVWPYHGHPNCRDWQPNGQPCLTVMVRI